MSTYTHAANALAAGIVEGKHIGQHVYLAALVSANGNLKVLEALARSHAFANGGFAGWIIIKELGQGFAKARLDTVINFEHVQAGPVVPSARSLVSTSR